MRTPVSQTLTAQQDLTDAVADGLAALLVSEYRRRHSQDNQPVPSVTVVSPRGPNHSDDESANGEDDR